MMRPLLIVFLLALALLAPATAQTPAAPLPPALSAKLERLRAEIVADTSLEEPSRQTLDGTLERAIAADRDADRLAGEARGLRESSAANAAEIARLERRLLPDSGDEFRLWREALSKRSAHDELAAQLDEARNGASQLLADLAASAADLATLAARPAAISERLASLRQQIDASRGAGAPDTEASPPSLTQRADALAREVQLRVALAEVQALEAEQDQLVDRRRLLEVRQRVQQRSLDQLERQIDVLEAMLAQRTDAELEQLRARLQGERDAIDAAETALVAAADANLALGEELASVANSVRDASEQARRAQRSGTAATESLENTRTRLALGADDDAVGLILLSERRRLQEPEQIADELETTRRDLARVQLRLIDLDEQRDKLDSPEQAVTAALSDVEDTQPEETARLRAGFEGLLATRSELLPRLETALRDQQDALVQLERAQQGQLESSTELARILDRQLLWIPSHEPVGVDWLRRQVAGWSDLFKPSRYVTSANLMLDVARERWPMVLLAFVLFVALMILRHSIPRRLEMLAQPLMRVRTDRFRQTSRALLLTALAILPWPLLLALLGWLLMGAGAAGKFSDSLGHSLISLSGGVLLWQALHWLSRERGLGHLHFRWTRSRRAAIRAALPWMALGLMPMLWLLTLAFVRGQEPAVDAAARLLLLAFCGLGGWVAWRMLAPGAIWTPRGAPNIEPARLRQLLRFGVPALLAALAALALNGYVLTAGVMLRCLWLSVSAILVVSVLHGLISRWFLLGERRLALKRLEQKREADAAGSTDRTGSAGDAMPELEPEEVTLESVNAQTRRLLRALTVAALALTLLAVWSDILPALARLDEINLWQYATVDADGKSIAAWVTLRALLFGLGVLVLTFIAARNLPGLVELGLLSRINLDAPTRYAITSISRYVIVVAGLVIGLGLLGVRWGQLQWMAAALTVGLGFGLQEIFANFVSGLIVLFERPYRVGDIITIGEVEGSVLRIKTRATTVLDWDNKEVVVPNKTFITERFVNWTLSDSVTRVVLKIGVAYASDPEKVRALLLKAAELDPLVLKQPAPTCWLLALGNSTLDYELRIFVAEIIDRNRARDSIYQRIISMFREQGIEIAFPQMDLWVRNAPPGAAAMEAGSRPEPAPPATTPVR